MSRQYHIYCEYFLLKHKPCHGNVNNYWGGPITDHYEDEDAPYLEDDNKSLVKNWYVDQFHAFQQTTYITSLEIVHADVEWLRIIIIECESPYTNVEE